MNSDSTLWGIFTGLKRVTMLKRTVVFSTPAYLSMRHSQLLHRARADEQNPDPIETSIPMEDLGMVVVEHEAITLTARAVQGLVDNGAVVVFCDKAHMPSAVVVSFDGNSVQTEVLRLQVNASLPLTKQLWQQIVQAKIRNQAILLRMLGRGDPDALESLAARVRSGDCDNREAVAARLYWNDVLGVDEFRRQREGGGANALLNYGYAILRAACARALVGSGLNCTLGLHHRNRYNAFCLADDVMEPFRPFVDREVDACLVAGSTGQVNKVVKQSLLRVLQVDLQCGDSRRPLMNALSLCAASLVRCLRGEAKQLVLPVLA